MSALVIKFQRRRQLRFALSLLASLFPFAPGRGQGIDYDGQDPDAAWRTTAAANIEQIRKADLNLTFRLPAGPKLLDAPVQVAMTEHAFKFGSAVDPRFYLKSQSNYSPDYEARLLDFFNTATLENHLKWRAWAGDLGSDFEPIVTQEGLDWLRDRQVDARGHNIMWTRYANTPNSIQSLLDEIGVNPSDENRQALYDAAAERISNVGTAVLGKVFAWDMLNEPRTSTNIEDALMGFTPNDGAGTITSRADLRARWFNLAKLTDPTATMFINEFGLLPGDVNAQAEANRIASQLVLDDLLAAGAEFEGLGFQSHFDDAIPSKQITGIPKVWELLDDFQTRYNVPAHITEFDYSTTNQGLQADYTRDFLTAVFAHPAVEAFTMWGFWEGRMANPDGALFDLQWNLKPNGQQYQDLVLNQWWTDQSGTSDKLGQFSLRGFKGSYAVRAIHNGQTFLFEDLILGDEGLSQTLVLTSGFYDTVFQGGDVASPDSWDNGAPSDANTGVSSVDGIASGSLSNVLITQIAGSIDFTGPEAHLSAIENGTQWRLEGGSITDGNSAFRINNAQLEMNGGDLLLGAQNNLSLGKGDALLRIAAGDVIANTIQVGTIAATTPGAKIIEFDLGPGGSVTLAGSQNSIAFGDDGDADNDYINFITGTQGSLTTAAAAPFYETLFDNDRLRIDGLAGPDLGLPFSETDFLVVDNGDGTTTLTLNVLLGDFNRDGIVDAADLETWQGGFGSTQGPGDLVVWQQMLGAGKSNKFVVPEPAAWVILALAAAVHPTGRRRRPAGAKGSDRDFIRRNTGSLPDCFPILRETVECGSVTPTPEHPARAIRPCHAFPNAASPKQATAVEPVGPGTSSKIDVP